MQLKLVAQKTTIDFQLPDPDDDWDEGIYEEGGWEAIEEAFSEVGATVSDTEFDDRTAGKTPRLVIVDFDSIAKKKVLKIIERAKKGVFGAGVKKYWNTAVQVESRESKDIKHFFEEDDVLISISYEADITGEGVKDTVIYEGGKYGVMEWILSSDGKLRGVYQASTGGLELRRDKVDIETAKREMFAEVKPKLELFSSLYDFQIEGNFRIWFDDVTSSIRRMPGHEEIIQIMHETNMERGRRQEQKQKQTLRSEIMTKHLRVAVKEILGTRPEYHYDENGNLLWVGKRFNSTEQITSLLALGQIAKEKGWETKKIPRFVLDYLRDPVYVKAVDKYNLIGDRKIGPLPAPGRVALWSPWDSLQFHDPNRSKTDGYWIIYLPQDEDLASELIQIAKEEKRLPFEPKEILGAKDYSGKDLSGKNLSGKNFANTNFEEADLSRANFSKANLTKAGLQSTNMQGTNFKGANLSGADVSTAYCEDADFSGADLNGADFDNAYLYNANLMNTNLDGTNFTGAILKGAKFAGADLNGAYFTGADVSGVDFTGIDLTNVDLEGARYNKKTKWPKSFNPKEHGAELA